MSSAPTWGQRHHNLSYLLKGIAAVAVSGFGLLLLRGAYRLLMYYLEQGRLPGH